MDLAPLIEAPIQIRTHVVAVVGATLLGLVIFLNRKGTNFHKTLGWSFVTLMTITAVSAVFIRRPPGDGVPSLAGFTPIHLFVLLTAVSLPMAIIHIKNGRVAHHARTMIGLFVGGIIIAGILAFLPGRIMNNVVFGG
ncbi:MAG: DUF2306 domain-containing protein [Parvularculaceae bacterium]